MEVDVKSLRAASLDVARAAKLLLHDVPARPLRLSFRAWSETVDFDPVYGVQSLRFIYRHAELQARRIRAQIDAAKIDALAGGIGIMNGFNRVAPNDFYVWSDQDVTKW